MRTIGELKPEQAYKILEDASKLNPGQWVEHSINVGKAARKLSIGLGVDQDKAESFGYLHDIGRKVGRCSLKHTIEGYNYLMELGYMEAARICLTHSFFENSVEGTIGKWDVSEEEKQFITNYIENSCFDIYDKIIQLADCIALSSGITILERRLVDVYFRYGFDRYTEKGFKERLCLQAEIEEKLGHSIYKLFKDELVESLENYKVKEIVDFLS